MRDYSTWWAGRTAAHVREIVGRGSTFREGLFEVDPANPNILYIWNNHRIEFDDRDKFIDVTVLSGSGEDLSSKFGNLKVPSQYKEVVSSVSSKKNDRGYTIRVRFREKDNASGRTQNDDKLFHSVYKTAVVPIFKAIK